MVVEVLREDQPWPIELPAEPPRHRPLEAVRPSTGDVVARGESLSGGWHWAHESIGVVPWSWPSIISWCMANGLELRSLPAAAQPTTEGTRDA